MKIFKILIASCAFIIGMGTHSSLLAADEQPAAQSQSAVPAVAVPAAQNQSVAPAAQIQLPDLGQEGNPPQSAQSSLKRDAICTRCHDESEAKPILAIYQTKHGVRGDSRAPNCQTCHGESENHLKGDTTGKGRPAPDVVFRKGVYAATDDKIRSAQCLSCHKGTARTDWDGSQHANNQMACNDCHKVHAPVDKVRDRKTQTEVCFTCHKDQRADTHKISTHPIDAGKVICSDCHNPHGSTAPKLLKKNTVNETCWQCHADKRGPFLWEHQPVTEDCTNCHTPHGSNITPLLKDRPPFLCEDCHNGPHQSNGPIGPGTPPATVGGLATFSSNATGRACMNCHVMIHGSNSPTGAGLHR
jgi:DmsE family decaheme c-type cytochrome